MESVACKSASLALDHVDLPQAGSRREGIHPGFAGMDATSPYNALDHDQVGLHHGDVGKHLLESVSLVGLMPLAVVAVFVYNRDAVLFGIPPVAPDLLFRLLDVG